MERTWTCTKFSNAASGSVFGMSWIVSLEPSDVRETPAKRTPSALIWRFRAAGKTVAAPSASCSYGKAETFIMRK